MCPVDMEIFDTAEIRQFSFAGQTFRITKPECSGIAVSFFINGGEIECITSFGIQIGGESEIEIITEAKIVAQMLEVKSSFC